MAGDVWDVQGHVWTSSELGAAGDGHVETCPAECGHQYSRRLLAQHVSTCAPVGPMSWLITFPPLAWLPGAGVGEALRRAVREETGLTCSCGIGPNRQVPSFDTHSVACMHPTTIRHAHPHLPPR